MISYSEEKLLSLIPVPDREANKYSRGRLVLVAGSSVYPGAACLAALSAQRMGAGYVEVVTDVSSINFVRSYRASLVVSSDTEWIKHAPPASVFGKPCAYVVGPGF